MATVYNDFNEREVRSEIFYMNDSALYDDEAHTIAADYDKVKNACIKGFAKISDEGTVYGVTSYKDTANTSIVVSYGASESVTVAKSPLA